MMFVWRTLVLWALFASPALGTALGRRDDIKGGRLQTELHTPQQQIELKPQKFFEPQLREEAPVQQVELEPASPLTQVKVEAPRVEETKRYEAPRVEETKRYEAPKTEEVKRYEARPQVVAREEPSKAQVRSAQRIEDRIEQLPQQRAEYDSQQVEVRDNEQRRLEEPAEPQYAYAEEQQQLRVQQQKVSEDKGLAAPAGMAEPYAFSYQVEGSSRSESSDANGVVRGQYTIDSAEGPSRVVDYVADQNGFRASVSTNEFGTESKSAANVALRTSQPNAEDITLRLEGKTREDLAAPGIKGAAPVQRFVKAPAPIPPLPLPVIAQAPVEERATKRRADDSFAKGQRFAQQEELELAAPIPVEHNDPPAKSAQLRSPKLVASAFQPRSFESATAHRVYRGPVPAAIRPAPAVIVRRDPASILRGPVPAVYRGSLHREHYPLSPVHAHRRQQVAVRPLVDVNPRVSFYGSSSAGFEEELPAFEHPEA